LTFLRNFLLISFAEKDQKKLFYGRMGKIFLFLILYLIISFIWLIASAFVSFIRKIDIRWLGVFVFTTIIYLPLALYYIRNDEKYRIRQAVGLTVLLFVFYLLFQILVTLGEIVAMRP